MSTWIAPSLIRIVHTMKQEARPMTISEIIELAKVSRSCANENVRKLRRMGRVQSKRITGQAERMVYWWVK